MGPIEIIVIIAAVAIVAGVVISAIIRKKQGKTGCDCGCSDCPCHGACSSPADKSGDKK